MSRIKCKCCGKEQDTTDLDEFHIYCPAHTGDENEVGVGLVCLNIRSVKSKSGQCPDCDLHLTKYRDGQLRGYRLISGTIGIKEVFCW